MSLHILTVTETNIKTHGITIHCIHRGLRLPRIYDILHHFILFVILSKKWRVEGVWSETSLFSNRKSEMRVKNTPVSLGLSLLLKGFTDLLFTRTFPPTVSSFNPQNEVTKRGRYEKTDVILYFCNRKYFITYTCNVYKSFTWLYM